MKSYFGESVPLRTNVIIGVTIIVGAIGGVYFVNKCLKPASQTAEKNSRKKKDDTKCNICFSVLNLEDIKSCVICCNCHKPICRSGKCSIWIPSESGWECQLCSISSESRSKTSEWLHRQINETFLRPMSSRSELSIPIKGRNENDFETHSETHSTIGGERKQKIREFIEDILANILGGSLDDVCVGQLARNKEYLPLRETEDCPGISHVKLKRLIEKIVEDTLRLPEFIDHSGISERSIEYLPYFDPKKYQELLATAVLNKIVDSYNYEKKFDNSETFANSNLDKNHNAIVTKKDCSGTPSISSIEPQSDSSYSDATIDVGRGDDTFPSDSCSNLYINAVNQNRKINGNEAGLSDYVAKHKVPLPDLELDSESTSEDFVSVATSNGHESTWEENWLFKKKKHGKDSPVSVGMLVPAPRDDIKAFIGDKTTDEVSDLSEAGSDFDNTECDVNMEDFETPNVRIQNKNVIGGKSPVGIFDELLEQTSLVSNSSIQEGESAFTETKNDFVLGNDGLNEIASATIHLKKSNSPIDYEAINSNVTTATLQVCPPKKSLESSSVDKNNLSLTEPPEDFTDDEKALLALQKDAVPTHSTHETYKGLNGIEIELSSSVSSNEAFSKSLFAEEDVETSVTHLLPGSIAEREHKKWYNAVEMPNNPYTSEALKRRLSNSGSDKTIDIPNINIVLEKATSEEKLNKPDEDLGSKSLQMVLENNQPDIQRYGRDYYINDAKYACGTRKRIEKESSTDSERVTEQELSEAKIPVNRSYSSGDKQSDCEDIFQARPVRVEESDPLLSKATKLEYLSTPERDFYILPTEEVQNLKSLGSTTESLQNSLTASSEDSDTIRVYDLKNQETTIIKDDKVKNSIEVNSKKVRPNVLTLTSKTPPPALKAVTPNSLKFLQPKRKFFDPIMSSDSELTSPIFEGAASTSTKRIENNSLSKPVIEKEVASSLPSVKALAQVFLSNVSSRASAPVNRPKSSSWHALDVKQCLANERKNRTKIDECSSKDSYVPPFNQTYCPGESPNTQEINSGENNVEIIEPRNLIPEIKENFNEIKEEIIINNNLPEEEQNQQPTEIYEIISHPDRPISPVLVPGLLKNNIAFFENLKNK